MRQYPPYANQSNLLRVVQDILSLRREDINEYNALQQGKLKGRIRTESRTVPSAATDVVEGDSEGDIVTDATYIYRLTDVPGTGLRWHRVSLSVGW